MERLTKNDVDLIDSNTVRIYARNSGMYWDVDLVDFEKVCGRTWSASNNGYGISKDPKTGKSTTLHRAIMGLTPGDGFCVDHLYGDIHNNRASALRIATSTTNNRNRKYVKGVWECGGKYYARIRANGEVSLGKARATYEEARAEYLLLKKEKHPDAVLVPMDSRLLDKEQN